MVELDVGIAQLPKANKDNDRYYIDLERDIYGVFDGEGNSFASDIAVSSIRDFISNSDEKINPELLVNNAHRTIVDKNVNDKNEHFTRGITTASLVHIKQVGESILCTYASAGDSPIYQYHQGGEIEAINDYKGEALGPMSVLKFLGAKGFDYRDKGGELMQPGDSIAIMSDGVINAIYPQASLSEQSLSKILGAELSAEQAAKAIVDGSSVDGDKTALVIRAL